MVRFGPVLLRCASIVSGCHRHHLVTGRRQIWLPVPPMDQATGGTARQGELGVAKHLLVHMCTFSKRHHPPGALFPLDQIQDPLRGIVCVFPQVEALILGTITSRLPGPTPDTCFHVISGEGVKVTRRIDFPRCEPRCWPPTGHARWRDQSLSVLSPGCCWVSRAALSFDACSMTLT